MKGFILDSPLLRAAFVFPAWIPVLPFLHCHVDLKHIHASAVLNHSRMNSPTPAL